MNEKRSKQLKSGLHTKIAVLERQLAAANEELRRVRNDLIAERQDAAKGLDEVQDCMRGWLGAAALGHGMNGLLPSGEPGASLKLRFEDVRLALQRSVDVRMTKEEGPDGPEDFYVIEVQFDG